jgi:hypothetical protein
MFMYNLMVWHAGSPDMVEPDVERDVLARCKTL